MTDTGHGGDLQRRNFLRGAALGVGAVGAVAGGATALAGGAASAGSRPRRSPSTSTSRTPAAAR